MTKADLLERIAALEAENAILRGTERASADPHREPPDSAVRAGRRRGWARAAVAAVLVSLGALLAPIAVVTGWAGATLTDTERFVATYAPLADDPAVQTFVIDEVLTAIETQVDLDALTSDLIDGVIDLGTAPAATRALELLKGPAASGVRSVVHDVVADFVSSEAFSDVWASALRVSHTQVVSAMSGDADAAVVLADDGSIGIQLGPIVTASRTALAEEGIGIAGLIPDIDRTIVVAHSDALPTVQFAYGATVLAGAWMAWIVLGLLTAGVVTARRRARTLVMAASALALAMIVLLSLLAVGRVVVLTSIAPSALPSDVSALVYGTVTGGMQDTAVALLVLAAVVGIVAWAAGPFAVPHRARAAIETVSARTRAFADARGLGTGRTGVWLHAQRGLVRAAIAVIAAAVILLARPVTPALILWTLALAVLACVALELLRRPGSAAAE